MFPRTMSLLIIIEKVTPKRVLNAREKEGENESSAIGISRFD